MLLPGTTLVELAGGLWFGRLLTALLAIRADFARWLRHKSATVIWIVREYPRLSLIKPESQNYLVLTCEIAL